jgi:hypothetical protein
MCDRLYTVNPTTGRILKNGKEFESVGATLYLFQSADDGYHRKVMSEACQNGFTSVRCVLIFEGCSDIELDEPWNRVESVLKIGEEFDLAVTVEVCSSLISWLETKQEDPYDEKWDDLFAYVIERSVDQFSEYTSLFLVTILNEVLPYRGAGFEPDPLFRRMAICANMYKSLNAQLLVGSGGLLHLSRKSGGRPASVTVPWIGNGNTKVPYWEAAYTCPSVDIGMIHIYSSTAKILDNQSEWDNCEKYTQFCKDNQRAFICDEFGLKLETVTKPKERDAVQKQGIAFLEAIGTILSPQTLRPSMCQMWNLSPNAQGYDWWPEYTPQLFSDGFEDVFEETLDYPMPNRRVKQYTFKPWGKKSVLLSESNSCKYDFPAGYKSTKLVSLSGRNTEGVKQVVAEISMPLNANVPGSITFRFSLKLRDMRTNRVVFRVQTFSSIRQNLVVPCPDVTKPKDKQYIYARLSRDFSENLNTPEEQYKVEWVDLHAVKFRTGNPVEGTFEIKNLKLLL